MLPICGSYIPSETINGYSKSQSSSPYLRLRYQPSHIGVLPAAGQKAQLILTENGTIPTLSSPTSSISGTSTFLPNENDEMIKTMDYPTEDYTNIPIYCSIKLEACSSCTFEIEFESPSWHFSEFEIDKISKCDEPNLLDKACFDIEIIEERAEQSIPYLATLSGVSDVFSRTSIWSIPNRKKIKVSGNSALIVVALRNIESNLQLLNYLNNLFPMNVVVYDNTEIIYGQPSDLLANQTSIGFIESPRYPEAYPRSIVKNYTIINENKAGFIRLTFDDFHVHFQSELKVWF
uniref:Uncharacterized protein n=1 Tax=Panagrolaimus sp. ES5 TaxID=591445 RepID=A0AC34F4T0_9BILA